MNPLCLYGHQHEVFTPCGVCSCHVHELADHTLAEPQLVS